MNIDLTDAFKDYIQRQLDTGVYKNASEVIREAHRLKIQEDGINQIKLNVLRSAIIEGEQSGDAEPFDMKAIINEAKIQAGLDA